MGTPVAPVAAVGDFTNGPATTIKYDAKSDEEYQVMWANIFGPLELAAGGTRSIERSGEIEVRAIPFSVGAEPQASSDHLNIHRPEAPGVPWSQE